MTGFVWTPYMHWTLRQLLKSILRCKRIDRRLKRPKHHTTKAAQMKVESYRRSLQLWGHK